LSAIFISLCEDFNPMSVAVGSVEREHAEKLASSMIERRRRKPLSYHPSQYAYV